MGRIAYIPTRGVQVAALFLLVISFAHGQGYLIDGKYSCNDTGMNAALAALPSGGGVVDASGCIGNNLFTSGTSTVSVGANQVLKSSPAAVFQPAGIGQIMFTISPGGTIDGIHVDASNLPGYMGIAVNLSPSGRFGFVRTLIRNLICSGASNNNSICLQAAATNQNTQSVAFVQADTIDCFGYGACIALSEIGNGFVNGNTFSNVVSVYSGTGILFNANGSSGSTSGNTFTNFVYQCCPSTGTASGVFSEGEGAVNENIITGGIWDTTGSNQSLNWSNGTAARNLFIGYLTGTSTDASGQNSWIDAGSAVTHLAGFPLNITHLNQVSSKNFAGSCSMSAATSCTINGITATYSSTPICNAFLDSSSSPPTTAIAVNCALSDTTITITAGERNSLTWDAVLLGNPN